MNDKRRRYRFLIAIVLGVIALAVTSLSFSFAWYASSARVEISGVDIYVRSERNLVLSTTVDGEYQNDYKYENLDVVGLFDPCSSMYRSDWENEKKDFPEFYRYDMPLVDATGTPRHSLAKKGLFSQEFFLKVDDNAYITLDKNLLIANADHDKNVARAKAIASHYPQYSEEEIVNRLDSVENCMRISLLITNGEDYRHYIIDPHKGEDTYYGGTLDLEKTGYYAYHVHDDELVETVFGEVENRDKIIYDEASGTDSKLIGEATSFNAKTKANVRAYDEEKSLQNGVKYVKEETLTPEEAEDEIVIDMYHDTPIRIVASFYMEGWDKDCTNAHMGSSFELGLGFKIIREM